MQVDESNHHYPNNHDDSHKLRVVRVGDLDVLVLADGGKAPGYYCFTFSMTNLLRIGKGALGMCLERNFATDRDSVLRLGRRPADGPTKTSFERVKEAYLEIKARVTGAIEAEDGAKADQLNLYPLALVLKLLRFYAPRYLGLEPTVNAVEQLLLGRGHDGQDKEHKAGGVPPAAPAEQQQVRVESCLPRSFPKSMLDCSPKSRSSWSAKPSPTRFRLLATGRASLSST